MHARRLLAFFVTVGCGSTADESLGDQDASSSESTAATSTSTASTATTAATGASSSTTDPTGADGTETGTSDADGSGTTEGPVGPCDFEHEVCAGFEDNEMPPMDCGFLTLADDLAAWEAARQCARSSALSMQPYKVLWEIETGATTRLAAMTGDLGEIYQTLRFDYEESGAEITATVTACTGVYSPDKCVVAVGEPCLGCLEPARPAALCD